MFLVNLLFGGKPGLVYAIVDEVIDPRVDCVDRVSFFSWVESDSWVLGPLVKLVDVRKPNLDCFPCLTYTRVEHADNL